MYTKQLPTQVPPKAVVNFMIYTNSTNLISLKIYLQYYDV